MSANRIAASHLLPDRPRSGATPRPPRDRTPTAAARGPDGGSRGGCRRARRRGRRARGAGRSRPPRSSSGRRGGTPGRSPSRSAITRSLAVRSAHAARPPPPRPGTSSTRRGRRTRGRTGTGTHRRRQERVLRATLDEPLIRQDVDARHDRSALRSRAYGRATVAGRGGDDPNSHLERAEPVPARHRRRRAGHRGRVRREGLVARRGHRRHRARRRLPAGDRSG